MQTFLQGYAVIVLSQRLHVTLGIDGRRNHLLNVKNEATGSYKAHTGSYKAHTGLCTRLILAHTKATGSYCMILRILAHGSY